MSVTSLATQDSYTSSGTTGPYTITFERDRNVDIKLLVDGVESTDFTLNTEGTELTTGVAHPVDTALIIYRETPLTQIQTFPSNTTPAAEDVRAGFDKVTLAIQEVDEANDRSIKLPLGETATVSSTFGVNAGGSTVTRTVAEELAHLGIADVADVVNASENYIEIIRSTLVVSGATTGTSDPNGSYTWDAALNAHVNGVFQIKREFGVTQSIREWNLYESGVEIATTPNREPTGVWTSALHGDDISVRTGTQSQFYSGVTTDITSLLNQCAYGDVFNFGRGTFSYQGLPWTPTLDEGLGNLKDLPGGLILRGINFGLTIIKYELQVGNGHDCDDGGTIFQTLRCGGETQLLNLTVDANAKANIDTIGVVHNSEWSENTTAGVAGSIAQVETLTVPASMLGYVGDLTLTANGVDFTLVTASIAVTGDSTVSTVAAAIVLELGSPTGWTVADAGGGVVTMTADAFRANDTTAYISIVPATDYVKSFTFPSRGSNANYGLNPHYGCFDLRGDNSYVSGCRFIGWTGGGCNISLVVATDEQYANTINGYRTLFENNIIEEPLDVAVRSPYTNGLSCRYGGIYKNNTIRYPDTSDDYWILGDPTHLSSAGTFCFGIHDNTVFENNRCYNASNVFHRDTLAINGCVMRGNRGYNCGTGVLFQMTGGDICQNIVIEENVFEVRNLNGTTKGKGIYIVVYDESCITRGISIIRNTIVGTTPENGENGIVFGSIGDSNIENIVCNYNRTGYWSDPDDRNRQLEGNLNNIAESEAFDPWDYNSETLNLGYGGTSETTVSGVKDSLGLTNLFLPTTDSLYGALWNNAGVITIGTANADTTTYVAAVNSALAPDWITATGYVEDDWVTESATTYRCVTPHTSAASFATDSANWSAEARTVTDEQISFIDDFIRREIAAGRDNTVHHRVYLPIWGVEAANEIPIWNTSSIAWVGNGTTYSNGDYVFELGVIYICVSATNHTSTAVFADDSAEWTALAWATGPIYYKGDYTNNGGIAYVCRETHISSALFDTDLDSGKWGVFHNGGAGSFGGTVTPSSGYVQGNGSTGYFNTNVNIGDGPDGFSGLGLTQDSGFMWALVYSDEPFSVGAFFGSGGQDANQIFLREKGDNVIEVAYGLGTPVTQYPREITTSPRGIHSMARYTDGSDIILQASRRNSKGHSAYWTEARDSSGTVKINQNPDFYFMARNNVSADLQVPATNSAAKFGGFGISSELNATQIEDFTLNFKNLWENITGLQVP